MKTAIAILISGLLFASFSFAAPMITVQGTYMESSKKLVHIKNRHGKIIKVPKKSVKTPLRGLIEGTAVIQAKLSIEDMYKLNGDPDKSTKKKKKK